MAAQINVEQRHNDHLRAPIINGIILLVVFPRGRPPRLRARPAPKRGLRRERLDWHIDTRKKLKAECLLSCTRVQRRFSCLLSLSSRGSQPLPQNSPSKDSFPEPILSESQPRSTSSIVVHTQSVRKEKPWKNRQESLSETFRAAITQNLRWQQVAFLVWLTLLLIAQRLNAITTRSDHGLIAKWRQKFIRTGMRILNVKTLHQIWEN